ncbi:PREDICTED: uncharacterized protein LOC100638384 [Amphimedon queenslandica]|uniref:Uncharacterized protein n=1 Tax=Amphimedon queenslandica TaxID=400682 RepID=A0A1X7V3P6_AMPQE|nr:PREDICTED: uncharacterized protein LOC100638384 [Amphimedon queenslandica]XP_019850803.1 PREDICTED: uncharacterized protein LOC100638384 [Amphimedon queenslandica]|eukprot:XP_019850802.1 PREDICTED: uncharacterized protein LOC100638384 [Amphimedon queenslandica]
MEASPPPSFMNSTEESSSIFHIRSHLFAILFCYIVGTLGLSVFFIAPILLLLWLHWDERCGLFEWITELKTEQKILRTNVIRSGESANWLNKTVDRWWSCCDGTVTKFVKDWIQPIVNKFRFPSVVSESIRILSFSTGPHRIKFSNIRLMQPILDTNKSFSVDYNNLNVFAPMTMDKLINPPVAMAAEGRVVVALEADADLKVPNSEFKMKASVGLKSSVSHNFMLNVESFHIHGRVRCVVSADKMSPFPHVSTTDLCFIAPPVLTVQVRVLKDMLEVSDIPVVKSIMEKFISYGFKTLLVFPGKQQVDFTPAPLPGPEWDGLRVCGLSQGVLTVRIECENMDNAKKSVMLNHYCKLRLGSQKCLRECTDGSLTAWSSTFSFLIRDHTKDKLTVKLKSKRKFRRDLSVAKHVINLHSIGIIDNENEDDSNIQKRLVRMSSDDGSIQLCLSLYYTPLPHFSLLQRTPAIDRCDINEAGVLYIHVHSAQNLISSSSSSSSKQKQQQQQQQLSRPSLDPYCIVRQDARVIFKTSPVVGSASPVWEKGLEILIPSCRGAQFSFDVCDGRSRSHDSPLWYAQVSLEMGKTQLIQQRLILHLTDSTSSSLPLSSPPCLFVSVIFRNVKTVNWTRDSLQEAYMLRTHRQSYASCLDITSKFLNPVTQSLSFASSTEAVGGGGDNLSTGTEYYQFGEESSSDDDDDDEGIVVTPTSFDHNGMIHRHRRRRSVSENNLNLHS